MTTQQEVLARISQMRAAVEQFKKSQGVIDTALQAVNNEIQHLGTDRYNSSAATQFRAQYANKGQYLSNISNGLVDFSGKLIAAADDIESAARAQVIRAGLLAGSAIGQGVLQALQARRNVFESAAEQYNVDPKLVAAILMYEHNDLDWKDNLQNIEARFLIPYEGVLEKVEVGLWEKTSGFMNWIESLRSKEPARSGDIMQQSFGASQMQIETLENLIDNGYVIPPNDWESDKMDKSLEMLLDNNLAPTLVAARIRQTIDHWNAQGVDISNRPDILATLYPIGLQSKQGVHSDPQPSDRGTETIQNYYNDASMFMKL